MDPRLSLGEVTAGTAFGFLFSLYSHKAPQYMIVIDVIAQVLILAFPLCSRILIGTRTSIRLVSISSSGT